MADHQQAGRARALHARGVAAAEEGRLDQAADLFRRAIAEAGDEPLYHCQLGDVLQAQGQFEAAATAYAGALALTPDRAELHYNLGTMYLVLRDPTRAEDEYRRALELDPGLRPARENLGTLFRASGRNEEAEGCYRRLLDLDADNLAAHCDLGCVLIALGRPDEAEAACRRGLARFPAHAGLHNNLGIALEAQDRYVDALAAFERAVELEPGRAEAHHNLGVVLERLERLEEAEAAYRASLRIDARNPVVQESLGDVLRRMGKLEQAADAYRAALALDPDNATAQHMLAALTRTVTRVAPRKHVTRTFDDYAEQYDAHLVGRLGYRVPQALRAALERVRGGRRFSTALDLGCGTGLLAERIADQVDHIVGVDLSPRMVARAEAKGLYARLHVGELLEFLEQAQPPRAGYDLIAAADVFVYVGDLAPIFAATHARLATEGLFAFSVEEAGGDGYTLGTSGRYAHSRAYLDGLASKCGLSVLLCEPLVLRREGVEDVGGLLCVLAKSP